MAFVARVQLSILGYVEEGTMNSYSRIQEDPSKRWYLNWVLKNEHFRQQKASNQSHGVRKQLLEGGETMRRNGLA